MLTLEESRNTKCSFKNLKLKKRVYSPLYKERWVSNLFGIKTVGLTALYVRQHF